MTESINGIEITVGVNNCSWNWDGVCMNPNITKKKLPPHETRDWESKVKCGFTILGISHCSGFEPLRIPVHIPIIEDLLNVSYLKGKR
jgi:hypothetical protein